MKDSGKCSQYTEAMLNNYKHLNKLESSSNVRNLSKNTKKW